MAKYIGKQVFYGLLKLLVVLTIVFFLIKMMKIDVINPKAPLKVQASIRHQLGLDLPILTQYFNFLMGAFTLNFGTSWKIEEGISVWQIIAEKLPFSLILALSSYVVSLIAGYFAGVFSAKNVGNMKDSSSAVVILLLHSIPTFVIGALIQLLGSSIGMPIIYDDSELLSWFLPILVLSLVITATFAKQFRFYLLDVYTQEYITTARAKGLNESEVLTKHARRNALVPMVQPLITMLVGLVTGSVSVEKLFNIPGIGNLLINATSSADQPVVLGMVFMLTTFIIIAMTLVNVLYAFIDPRIKLG